MGQMRTLIVMKSVHHLNTAKVVKAIADVLHADVLSPEKASPEIVPSYDLIGIASGIYFGRFHADLRAWVNRLHPFAERRRAFLVSTAGLSGLQSLWHGPMRRKLSKIGIDVVDDFCCRGHDTVGPLWLLGGLNRGHPNDQDIARAIAFGEKLRSRTAKSSLPCSHGR